MMKISIITPVYNGEAYIYDTIMSVFQQITNNEIEYIIIDGNSTDNTLNIIKKAEKIYFKINKKKRHRLTFKYISEPDDGMYDALRKGFTMCTGEIVAWLNADDIYFENTIDKVCKIFLNQEIKWLTGRTNVVNEKGDFLYKSLLRCYPQNLILNGSFGLHSNYFIPQESVFWRKELLEEVNYEFFKKLKLAGDFYLWYQFAEKYKLYTVDEDFAAFRKTNNNLSSDKAKYCLEMEYIIGGKYNFSHRDQVMLRSYTEMWNIQKEMSFEYIKYDYELKKFYTCNKQRQRNYKKVSVITVCRNEKNIRYTCESVVNQTFQDFEWIVIDGCSTDNTLEIINEYEKKIDVLISEPDKGIYSAMNKGINKANGEWLIFLNGGDQFNNFYVLEKVFLNQNYDGVSVLYGNEERFLADGRNTIYYVPELIPKYFMCYQAFPHQSMFYRKYMFEKYGGYDETYRITGDSEKNTQLLLAHEKFQHIDVIVSTFVLDGISNNRKYKKLLEEEKYRRRIKYYSKREVYLYSDPMTESDIDIDINLHIPIIKVRNFKNGKVKKYYLFNKILLLTAERVF